MEEDQHQHIAGEARRGHGSICKVYLFNSRRDGEIYPCIQTVCEITGEVVIEPSDKTVPGLVLPDIFYNMKRKLGCILVESHNLESIMLKQEG